jgi:hypothetical protein
MTAAGPVRVLTAKVNPGLRLGVNPDSHPWADAADGCPGAR